MQTNGGAPIFLSLIIPAYNEGRRITSTLGTVQAYLASYAKPYEVIVVNDGSDDDTLQRAKDYAANSTNVRVVSFDVNRGKGYAVRQGVLASRGDYVAFSDADLSAPITELSKLFEAIEKGYEIAIGSRAVKGAKLTVHQPRYREFGGKALNLIIQMFAVPGIWDTQCGFKLFRGEVAREIFSKCFIDGWGFDIEVLYLARRLGYGVTEVPVEWGHAEDSKIRPLSAALQVIRDIFRIRFHNYGI